MTQPIVVAAFRNAAEATRAAERLRSSGTPDANVTLHRDTPDAANTAAVNTDEMLTGGLVASFGHLLDGLMATSPPPGDVATYRDLVRREGTLLTVKVASAEAGQDVKASLEAAGAQRIAVLPQPGLDA